MMKKFTMILTATLFLASGPTSAQDTVPKPAATPTPVAEPEIDPDTQRLIEEAKQKILKDKAEKAAAEKKAREEAAKKAEPELNPETQRLIEEAKQKIIREQAEKEANEKKAREEAANKPASENGSTSLTNQSFFGNIKANSNLYAGVTGGLGLSLNKIHGTGFSFGGIIDYILFKHYGLHLGVETGQYPTQAISLTSGNSTIPIVSGGTLGFLAIDATAFYAFPKLIGIDSALGFGLAYYRLTGGNYEFNSMIAPRISASFYYTIFASLQVGLIWNMTFASASKITTGGTEYPLDSSAGLTVMGVQVAVRYGLF